MPPIPEHRGLSLFQRYTALADDTARLRREREQLEADLEALAAQDRALEGEEARLRRAAAEAERAARGHGDRLRDLEAQHRRAGAALAEAVVAQDASRRRREAGECLRAGEHRAFLEAAVAFRGACRRLQVDAMACGLEYAPVAAYMESLGMDRSHLERLNQQSMEEEEEDCDDDDLEADPVTWTIDPNDEDTSPRFKDYLRKRKLYDEAEAELIRVKELKEAVCQRIHEREQQEQNLQEQLNRILKENADIEQQIHELELLMKEAEQRKEDVIRQKSIQNPYKQITKKRTVTPSSASAPLKGDKRAAQVRYSSERAARSRNDSSDDRRSHCQDIVLGQAAMEALHRSQTRRFGRNHFGSRLQVDEGFLAASEGQIGVDTQSPEPSAYSQPAQSLFGANVHNDDDEDDDDDGTLDFVAFSGKQRCK